MKDDLGDRMKGYEKVRTNDRVDTASGVVYARLDGRGFSKFTKGMRRPFDSRMSDAMIEVTKYLVSATNAIIGYTQSDEISLLWQIDEDSQMMFDAKIQKLTSVLASMATAKFVTELLNTDDEFAQLVDKLPHFDCRVFELPDQTEGTNAILWRVKDAQRNAISMTAHHHFGHKATVGVSTEGKLKMLSDASIGFTDYPYSFRYGTFVRRVKREVPVYMVETIPDAIKKKMDPLAMVERWSVEVVWIPQPFSSVSNRTGVIFNNENAILHLTKIAESVTLDNEIEGD